jgi:hypothetical protein
MGSSYHDVFDVIAIAVAMRRLGDYSDGVLRKYDSTLLIVFHCNNLTSTKKSLEAIELAIIGSSTLIISSRCFIVPFRLIDPVGEF